MPNDQFKNVGQYLEADEFLELTEEGILGPDWTVDGWFIWLDGRGPLFETTDERVAFVADADGLVSYRVGGVDRVISVSSDTLREHWIYVAVALDASGAILRVNERTIDVWPEAPHETLSARAYVMKEASGFAADIAHFARRLPDDRLDAHWNAGKSRV